MSQGKGSGVEDTIAFDVHAINELQSKGVLPTNDSMKYSYRSASDSLDSAYGRQLFLIPLLLFLVNFQFFSF